MSVPTTPMFETRTFCILKAVYRQTTLDGAVEGGKKRWETLSQSHKRYELKRPECEFDGLVLKVDTDASYFYIGLGTPVLNVSLVYRFSSSMEHTKIL